MSHETLSKFNRNPMILKGHLSNLLRKSIEFGKGSQVFYTEILRNVDGHLFNLLRKSEIF